MDFLKAMEEKAFWGHEFLTWLWFRSETEGGEFEVEGQGPVALWVEDRLVMESLDSESRENILKTGDVSRSAEAAAALGVGKKVTQARFGMSRGEDQWSFLVDGATLDIRGMKIPTVSIEGDDEDDDEGTILVRLGLMRMCTDALDSLFREFVGVRVSGDWQSEVMPAMSLWIKEKEGN